MTESIVRWLDTSAPTDPTIMPLQHRSRLATPPLPCVVPEGVFDAFGWCRSEALEWRRPSQRPFDDSTPVDGSDPTRMVFVFHAACTFLPQELAALHATGMGLTDEWALAPYAIDDATDELYERRVEPASLLWLAADNLNALFWGLHDWAHFHNHGPFDERAWTELQCDAAALAWVRGNRAVIGIDEGTVARLEAEVTDLCRKRFVDEGREVPEIGSKLTISADPAEK